MKYRDSEGFMIDDSTVFTPFFTSTRHKEEASEAGGVHPIPEVDNSSKVLSLGGTIPFGYERNREAPKTRLGKPFYKDIWVQDDFFRTVVSPVKDSAEMGKKFASEYSNASLEVLNSSFLAALPPKKQIEAGNPTWKIYKMSDGLKVFDENSKSYSPLTGEPKIKQLPDEGLSWVWDVRKDRVVVWHKTVDAVEKVFDGLLDDYETQRSKQVKTLDALHEEYRKRLECFKALVTEKAFTTLQKAWIKDGAFLMPESERESWIRQTIDIAQMQVISEGKY